MGKRFYAEPRKQNNKQRWWGVINYFVCTTERFLASERKKLQDLFSKHAEAIKHFFLPSISKHKWVKLRPQGAPTNSANLMLLVLLSLSCLLNFRIFIVLPRKIFLFRLTHSRACIEQQKTRNLSIPQRKSRILFMTRKS